MESHSHLEIVSERYSAGIYKFPPEFIAKIHKLNPINTFFDFLICWLGIAAIAVVGQYLRTETDFFWMLYFPLGFLMAGRQGALLQLIHEGSHRLLAKNSSTNNFLANWLAALPIGLSFEGYTKGHMQHHAGTNTSDDLPSDMEKYSEVDFKSKALVRLFLLDLAGITALKSFFGHNYMTLAQASSKNPEQANHRRKHFYKMSGLLVVQLILLFGLFRGDLVTYILLWITPLISFNMILLRFRGIAEHGRPLQEGKVISRSDQGNMYTRTVLLSGLIGLVERVLIGSLNASFHHEHHLLPKVPHYNLVQVHKLKKDEIEKRVPGVFVPGYFRAALWGSLNLS